MEGFSIRPYQKGDEIVINNCFNDIFGTNRTLHEWKWKYEPVDKASRILIALGDENEILAHYACVYLKIQIDGKIYTSSQALDSYSIRRKDVLKNRVFMKLYDEFGKRYAGKHDINCFYGCIGGRHKKLGTLAMNYSEPVLIPYFYKETSYFLRPLGYALGTKIWKYYLSRNILPKHTEIDDLWNRSKFRYPVSIIKDGTYFESRYFSHPVKKFMYLQVWERDQLKALAVILLENRLLKWVDLVWDGSNSETIAYLESKIWSVACKTGAIKVEFWLNNDDDLKEILINCGMKTCTNPYDLYLTTRSFSEEIDEDDFRTRFYLTMGNTDII